jgi:hypothetical protein
MNSNALATISTGAFAYKSSTSIFDEGRSIFSKLGTSDSINPYENFINGIRTDKYGDVPYIKSKTYISQATDEEVKEIERKQRDENPQPGDYGDGLWGKFAYTWLSLGNRLSQWEEQNQAFMNFVGIVPAILGGSQVAMENEAVSNYDMMYEEEQANIRERVSQNIEESKTAREASNYEKFAEFENGFKVGDKTELGIKSLYPRGDKLQYDIFIKQDEIAFNTYTKLRETGLDENELKIFSENTGLSIDTVTKLKEHVILTEHQNLLNNETRTYFCDYFQPDLNIAYGWEKALKGELNATEKAWFKQLAESELMKQGIPYRTIESINSDGFLTGNPPGAHDLAPLPPGDFPGFEPRF